MSKIALSGNASGTGVFTFASPNSNTDRTLDIPDASGVIDRLNRAGNVLQVVSTTKADTFSTTASQTWTDITGLSVSITPTSSTSKILVVANVNLVSRTSTAFGYLRLVRDSTAVGNGTVVGSRVGAFGFWGNNTTYGTWKPGITFLDSPATTSTTTYKIQFYGQSGGHTFEVNTIGTSDSDSNNIGRFSSDITIMEIAG